MQMLMQQINELADRDLRPEFLLACGKIYNKATELLPVNRKEIKNAYYQALYDTNFHDLVGDDNCKQLASEYFSTKYGD